MADTRIDATATTIGGVRSKDGGIIDINEGWKTLQRLSKKGKLSKRGKTRIDIKADPLVIMLDAREPAAMYAATVRDVIQMQFAGVNEEVANTTLLRRKQAFNNQTGKWYRRRYGGGKIGSLPPDQDSRKWGTDSGRMSNNLAVTPRRNSSQEAIVTVNVPANRLEPISFGIGDFAKFRHDLRRLVPALSGNFAADPATLRIIENTLEDIAKLTVATRDVDIKKKLRQRRRMLIAALATALGGSSAGRFVQAISRI